MWIFRFENSNFQNNLSKIVIDCLTLENAYDFENFAPYDREPVEQYFYYWYYLL